MIRRMTAVALFLMVAVPAWAHCGKCGVGGGDEADKAHGSHGEHAHDHEHAEVGKPAPDFELKSLDGKAHKLSDYKGKIVVLEWTNHQCPIVLGVHKAGVMREIIEKFKDKDVVWLAIDSSYTCEDKKDDIKEWAEDHEVEYPILLDAPGEVGHIYGAKATPHMFVIDKKGVLAYDGAIDDNKLGDKEEPRNYVEEAVSALLEGTAVATSKTKPYGCSVKYKKK